MKKNDLNTLVVRKKDIMFSELDHEIIMFNLSKSEYYGFNEMASRIWHLLENEISLKQLIELLMDEYEVTYGQCREEVIAFLNRLNEKKLVTLKDY